jgi:phosphomannomutase/phosphoglucomutase
LVRASNTTPVLVLRFEADSELQLTEIKKQFREQMLALRSDLYLPF